MGTRSAFAEEKSLERETKAEVEDEWSYASTPYTL